MQQLADEFTKLYFSKSAFTTWRDVPIQKCPLDLWMYQVLINQVKPEVIVECGTAGGGSAFYLANMLDLMGPANAEVVTVDIQQSPNKPRHGRITYLTGSSVDPFIVTQIARICQGRKTMVILDSDHHAQHVFQEMRAYSPMVDVGSYMIVEDSVVHHPLPFPDYPEGGPWAAIKRFMQDNDDFEHDSACEVFLLTYNPGGYLLRMRRNGIVDETAQSR